MDREDTEFIETLRKHGWKGVHWDDRQANVRDSVGLRIAATVIVHSPSSRSHLVHGNSLGG